MPFVDSNNMRTYFEWSEEKDLPVLVLSNSLGADLSMWNAQIEEFSKHFRVLRYDTRGHGRSETTPGTYTIEQLGGDVIAMLDELNLRHVAFCGLSMGGMIGQWLAIHAKQYLENLILANTSAKIGTAEDGMRASIRFWKMECRLWFHRSSIAGLRVSIEHCLPAQLQPRAVCWKPQIHSDTRPAARRCAIWMHESPCIASTCLRW